MDTFVSDLSGRRFPVDEKIEGRMVLRSVMEMIRHDFPHFTPAHFLSLNELNTYRERYIACVLDQEGTTLSAIEQKVIETMDDPETADNLRANVRDCQADRRLDRFADRVAAFGGSWTFIVIFLVFLLGWIVLNTLWFIHKKVVDPYPFVLLNLILSYLAGLQAPLIMMSQNRHSDRDRRRAKEDYLINLKSEMEVRTLHEKLDHLIVNQQKNLIEAQKFQIDLLADLRRQVDRNKAKIDEQGEAIEKISD